MNTATDINVTPEVWKAWIEKQQRELATERPRSVKLPGDSGKVCPTWHTDGAGPRRGETFVRFSRPTRSSKIEFAPGGVTADLDLIRLYTVTPTDDNNEEGG